MRSWCYHPELGAEIFDDEEAAILYKNGWYDTPDKFPKSPPEPNLEAEESKPKRTYTRRKPK